MAHDARRRGHIPPPDSPRRLLLIRGVTLVALAATAAYLGWRALFAGRYAVAGTVRRPWAELLRRELAGLSRRFLRPVERRDAVPPRATTADLPQAAA